MKIIYRALRQDPNSREGIITVTSAVNIFVNLIIASFKIAVGIIVSSIAITTEGVNNATDVFTSLLTVVGTRFSKKRPDKRHPFGYGRIEYLMGLAVSALIIVTGLKMFISSVKLAIKPERLGISYISAVIIIISAIIKLFLGLYTIKKGKQVESFALEAVGLECKNDFIVSAVTIFSLIVFLIFNFSIDAYVGIFSSAVIMKSGVQVFFETMSALIGCPGEHGLANEIYGEIREASGVLSATDMMLHNYGPNIWSGSVKIEIDHKKEVGEICSIINALQFKIKNKYNVAMVFGIDAVDNDGKEISGIRRDIEKFVSGNNHILNFHALYFDADFNRIHCGFTVDYEIENREKIKEDFKEYMYTLYPQIKVELTVRTEFV